MNKGEAWSAIERLRTVQLTLNGMFPEEFWKQHDDGSARKNFPSCYGIGEVAKGLKDYITANDDADSARLVNDMVYGGEQKDNLCNILNTIAFYSDSPEDGLAREMRDAAKYLLDICDWLVSAVYKVPFHEAYKYVVKGDKLIEVKEEERHVIPKADNVQRSVDNYSADRIVKSDLPKALQTDEAVQIFERALKAGLFEVVGRGRYRWMESKSLLGYFVDEVRKRLNLKCGEFDNGHSKYMIRPFEELFGVRQIGGIINDYKKNTEETPVKHELVDAIME